MSLVKQHIMANFGKLLKAPAILVAGTDAVDVAIVDVSGEGHVLKNIVAEQRKLVDICLPLTVKLICRLSLGITYGRNSVRLRPLSGLCQITSVIVQRRTITLDKPHIIYHHWSEVRNIPALIR